MKWHMCHMKTIGNVSQEDKKISQKIRDIFQNTAPKQSTIIKMNNISP